MASEAVLEELIPGIDYGGWYQDNSGYEGDETYFGAYALEPIGSALYIGFGTARPAENSGDGALLARSDGTSTLTKVGQPTEQGFIDMSVVGSTLYIPGADPCCVDDWTWGNIYTFNYPNWTQYRQNNGLVNVIHSWGLWYDGAGTHYAAVSSCDENISPPNNTTCNGNYQGKVFNSTDSGVTWNQLARGDNPDNGVGQYRTYDIIGFGPKLYVTWNDVYGQACGLAESGDGGTTWTRLPDLDLKTACRARLLVFNNQLLILKSDQTGLFVLNDQGQLAEKDFPDFEVKSWAYNYATEGGAYLYTITEEGQVVRTTDLETWDTLISTDRPFITIAYWPAKNWLILADSGRENAGLWKIDLESTPTAITLPLTLNLSIEQEGGTATLSWDASTDQYRVYRSDQPYNTPYLAHHVASPNAAEYDDSSACEACFYGVRAKVTDNNLSPLSNRVGRFEFSLTAGE
ncbi:MAG: hypothetical protein GY759_09325 [Chloroflexi bacterium]|nr:hypothetical protein [Chloroflexota bacterium]